MAEQKQPPVGYDDTPFLPNWKWRVHDAERPAPKVVTPGEFPSQDKPGVAPSDAIVLFDGEDVSQWQKVGGGPVGWKVENGYMEVVGGAGNIETKEHFGDCQVHVEWAAPAEVTGSSQGRGNSGVFLMGKYEIQVLDGYDNRTYADGITAAIYGQYPPLVNACVKPGEWHTYDIFFKAPRYDGDRILVPAIITVMHNGVLVHHATPAMGPTGHRNLSSYYPPHPPRGPLMLQDHRDPVRYRYVWIREVKDYDEQ